MTKLKVGDVAPNFTLKNYKNEEISLSNFKDKPVVVYFYPKNFTPGCTKEACEFRDKYEEFVNAGAEVIGISDDDLESHKKFAERYKLPFSTVQDVDNKVAKEYGVGKKMLFIPSRITFILDKNHVVKSIHDGLLDSNAHIKESLKTIQELKN